ncbi:hypothetical protein CAPTEDRAFT_31543, partial [Capitella teleta]
WQDQRLRWNPEDFDGLSEIKVDPNVLWIPDLMSIQSAAMTLLFNSSLPVSLHHDGRITWKPRVILPIICSLNLHLFPFDEQNCRFELISWSHTELQVTLWFQEQVEELDLVPGLSLDAFDRNPAWDIKETHGRQYKVQHGCCIDRYWHLGIYIRLRRGSLFYIVNVLTPILGIYTVTLMSFCLPCESSEKI